jgi:hypothetical protein
LIAAVYNFGKDIWRIGSPPLSLTCASLKGPAQLP